MNIKDENDTTVLTDHLQGILNTLTRCKTDYLKQQDDNIRLRDINSKLEEELREIRELEKSHRYHLLTSREMIGNLQETVSQLVHLKRDLKKLKDEVSLKDSAIAATERDKENLLKRHGENIMELRNAHEKQIEELRASNEKKIQQMQHESDTQIAQFTCVIEELRNKIKDTETEHKDKMNIVVLDYEEKIQRGAAQMAQLQEQLARQAARSDANIDAYRRRLEELEEKLKQSQFKQYLAQSSHPSQYESQVERPYSVDPYADASSVDLDPVLENSKSKFTITSQNKTSRPASTLQVMYYGNKTPSVQKNADKKGQFNITKKRKLFSEKDLHDF